MRFSAVVLTALATSSSAYLFSRQLPSCVLSCGATADLDGCVATDNKCLCASNKFVNNSTECILKTCPDTDLVPAIKASRAICAAVGITLTSVPLDFPTSLFSAIGFTPAATGAGSPAPTGAGSGSPAATSPTAPAASGAASINGIHGMAGLVALGLAALAL